MDTKKLRQKILDLAIHGKLVPQDSNDEPASVLLERIRAEKERLIKEGKIKKSKASKTSDTPHYEQVPEGWCITNIGDLLINRDGERKPVSSAIRSKQVNKIYDYYGAAGVIDKVDDYIFDERLLLIGEDGANLLSRSKDNAFFAEGKYWVNNHAHVLDATDKFILDYVAIVINAMKLDDYVTGSAQPKLSQDNLNKIPIYLPPLEEQKRILVEINRLFDLIYKLELGKADLATIVKQAKTKILDLAIHGKLVPQNHNDEPASELLKRINPKAELTCDNGQYGKIPDGWCLCRLGDIGEIVTGNTPTKDIAEYYGGNIPFYKPADLEEGKFIKNASDNLSVLGFEQARRIPANSILVTCIGATIGKTGLIIVEGSCNQQINAIIPNEAAYAEFIYYTCISDYMQKEIKSNASATTLPILNKGNFAKLPFPLPPLAEQQHIVTKIEELFTSLDNIQKALEV
jgi:type I restriction enzyme S subunit